MKLAVDQVSALYGKDSWLTKDENWLVTIVNGQAQKANIKAPDIGIYPSTALNAFAIGLSRNNAIIVVSQGLLDNLSMGEIEAVVAHEVSHISNGDMVTQLALRSVLNSFSMLIAVFLSIFLFRRIHKNFYDLFSYFPGIIVLIIASWHSRQREFKADAGGANLVGYSKMIAALRRFQVCGAHDLPIRSMVAFGIISKPRRFISKVLASHPSIEERILRLEKMTNL